MEKLFIAALFLLPLVDVILWAQWKSAKPSSRKTIFAILVAIVIPQAAFLLLILFRIGFAIFTGVKV